MSRLLAGIFDPRGRADSSRLARALAPHAATVLHRGPLRLAFSGPACASGEPLCLFDGFLDNGVEIAEALRAPTNAAPEELLAAGYRRWGRELLPRLRGDFVLLVWDCEQGEGLAARDQLGVRSLYLSEAAGGLCFASEINHLLALLPTRPAPDRASVAHWIAVSNRPGAATLFAGVRRLNPGSVLLLDRRGAREEVYWRPRFAEPLELPDSQLAERVRSAIECAVRRRIDPDGETGVLMSGGLDSASVAAVAATQAPDRVSAYSGVFPEHPLVDEADLIDQLRGALALSGINAEVRAGGLLASALESLAVWQLPLLGWGDFWVLPLLRTAASAGVTVTLDGDGGDELFGPRSYVLADRLRGGHLRQALGLALELPGAGDRPPRRQVARVLGDLALTGAIPYGPHNALWRTFAPGRTPRWIRSETARELVGTDDPFAWKRLDGPRWWAHIAHGLTRGVEETGIFEHQRRRAALAGLEARHPLFDLDLVELGLRQRPEATLDRHRNRPVLRMSMAGLLPDSVRLRPAKAWFDSLIVDCLSGADGVAVQQLITDPCAELRAYVDPDGVRRALFDLSPQELSDPFRWMHQVWRLVTAECWLRSQHDPGSQQLCEALKPSPPRVSVRPVSASRNVHSYVFPP
ncbi:MAG: asparagine synthetase B family protein [Solirubrobacteraceae bacterium]